MIRFQQWFAALFVLALAPLGVAQAQFNNLQLDKFSASKTTADGFALSRPNDFGHLRFSGQIYLDYGNDPLVYEATVGGETREQKIVEHQLVGTANVALGLWNRLVLFGAVPLNLWYDGQEVAGIPGPGGFIVGDPSMGARVRLLGSNTSIFGLAVQGTVSLPAARWADSDYPYAGERGVTVKPELLLELRPGIVRITGNVGVRVRDNYTFANTGIELQDELTYGLGLTVWAVPKRFALIAEAYGATGLQDFGSSDSSPLELIGGFKAYSRRGWVLGAAAGPGFLSGVGSPDVRALFMVGYGTPEKETKKANAPATAQDGDGDGLLDAQDSCPNEAEDKDNFQDEDGCPDLDDDGDGVADANDKCPQEAEDKDGFEDEDGCPDADNDGDGIADAEDKCPMAPEDKDSFEDEDGCPDVDNDQDGVLDAEDECPTAPGEAANKGCPKSVRMGEGQILILERVEFSTGKAKVLPKSFPMLTEVRKTISANPQILKVRVEGHTDDRGKDARNLKLSKDRAKAVAEWLATDGLERERIEAYGCGETRPLEDNKTNTGRQANRRVEFHIVDPAPEAGAQGTEGCEAVE